MGQNVNLVRNILIFVILCNVAFGDNVIWEDEIFSAHNTWNFGTDSVRGKNLYFVNIDGTTITDGTASLTGGNWTGVGNITGSDVDISAGTGSFTGSGTSTFGQIIDSGLTASLGVYTDGSKQLTSTPPTSGVLGYWSRAGTVISTATAGDDVTTTGLGTFGSLLVDVVSIDGGTITTTSGSLVLNAFDSTLDASGMAFTAATVGGTTSGSFGSITISGNDIDSATGDIDLLDDVDITGNLDSISASTNSFTRTSSVDNLRNALTLKHETSVGGGPTDATGILINWAIGATGAANNIGKTGFLRDGDSTSGKFIIQPRKTGTFNTGFSLDADLLATFFGDVKIETGVLYFKETTSPTPITDYATIHATSDNELFFTDGAGAEHLLHGDAFSNIWFASPSTVEVTISTEDLFTIIDSFTVVGHEDDLSNVVGNISTNTLTLSSIGVGEYEISYHGSITATGGADKNMLFAFGITLATVKDITNVTDNTITPIVITSTAHGLENGDMVEIVNVLGNTAANGSFFVAGKADDTFQIVALDNTATTGNGDYNEGSPTGDIPIEYPGNMMIRRAVRGADLGAISATGVHILASSDVLSLYVANLDGTTNLTVASVSFEIARIGD